MADIYNKQVISNFAHNVPGDNGAAKNLMKIGQGWEQKGQQMEQQAKSTYAKVLNAQATDTMEKLYMQYQNDPVGLQKAFDDTYNKTMGEIVDDDVKVAFAADCALKSKTYLSKAYDNKKKVDYRRYKSATFDSIQKNNSLLTAAFSNLVSDTFDVDNIANFNLARYSNDQLINTMNEDGTYMFTDDQRKQQRKEVDRNLLVALKSNFDGLVAYQKSDYIKRMLEDNVQVPIDVDKDKNVVMRNLQDVISPESYATFKDYVEKVSKRKQSVSARYNGIDDEDAWNIANNQTANAIIIESEISNIKDIKKDKPVERVLRNLELQDNIQGMGEDALSESDYKKYRKETMIDLMNAVKNDADTFDDAWFQESVMSVGLQAMKNDGKIGEDAWSDNMSVVMIRDYYSMLKEAGLDPRARDGGSRESAKKLAYKAISNTIERASGGYGKEFNSIYMFGRKVSKQPIKRETDGLVNTNYFVNPNYVIEGNNKVYNETGIKVGL